MIICEIVQYVRFLSDKEQRSNAFTPEQINLALKSVNNEIFNIWLTKFNREAIIPEPLRKFLVTVDAGTITSGVYTIPSDFRAMVSGTANVLIGGKIKTMDILPESEVAILRTYPGRKASEKPFGALHNGTFKIYPTNAGSLGWTYLKSPATPVYDYYIDVDLNEVCISPGVSHELASGEAGSVGQTTGTVVSGTVEIEWDERIHDEFVARMLEKLGVNAREQDLVQFSQMRKQEQIQTK